MATEPARYGIGQHATQSEIAAWDIDVKPNGEGLPVGEGTPAQGKVLYADQCEQDYAAFVSEIESGRLEAAEIE